MGDVANQVSGDRLPPEAIDRTEYRWECKTCGFEVRYLQGTRVSDGARETLDFCPGCGKSSPTWIGRRFVDRPFVYAKLRLTLAAPGLEMRSKTPFFRALAGEGFKDGDDVRVEAIR
jgi:hypothetical protein